jgi:hypothetical protein
MLLRRPTLRIVALLVYALVVNAVVWANASASGHGFVDSSLCTGGVDGPGIRAPNTPAKPGDAHISCDLACAAASPLAASPSAAMLVAPTSTAALGQGDPASPAGMRLAAHRARGPPLT